jgi:pyrroline-5-carboxylate reductase
MNEKTIGFIGGGRIARVILGGWQQAGKLPASVIVCDVNEAALTTLKKHHGSVRTAVNGNKEASSQDIVFIAVHPPAIPAVLGEIKASLKPSALVVSLAPKFTFARLRELLGGFERIARVIPNAPSFVGAGYNPVAFAPSLSEADRASVLALWEPLGQCPVVAEEKLDVFALLSARGPNYFWFQFQELERLGVSFGLTTDEATSAVRQMARGAVATLADAGLSPEAVMDLIPFRMGAEEETIRAALRANVEAGYRSLKG